jgi:DNA polymerase-1
MNGKPPRLLLVDGHYYLYRSFFAIRGLTNSKGEPTNAIYGFVKALRRMLADLRPDYAAVIWDAGLPERRTQLQPDYKQHRDEMPDDLEVQQEPIQEIVPLLGVASLFLENHEADDLIASYVVEACRQGIECVVATNDKDILQMVRDGVSIYSTAKADVGEGNGGFKLLGIPEVTAKWGVEPSLIADVLALTGDSADNIPGVPGVGGKTAAKWINQYGSLDRILEGAGLDPKVREKVEASRRQIESNRQMVALDLDLPLPLPIGGMKVAPRYPELLEALRRCEFRSLTTEVEREAAAMKPEVGNLKPESAEGVKSEKSGEGQKSEVGGQRSGGTSQSAKTECPEAVEQLKITDSSLLIDGRKRGGEVESESESVESPMSKVESVGWSEKVSETESAMNNEQPTIPVPRSSAAEQGELF